jgi:glutamate synthase (NADPH/NADH) small chain
MGLKVVRTRLSVAGKDSRRTVEPVPGSEHSMPADLVVEAIGQQLGPELTAALARLRLTGDGLVWTRTGSFETSLSGVYAAGDIINGGTTVVQAVGEGARAAREIDAWLRERP